MMEFKMKNWMFCGLIVVLVSGCVTHERVQNERVGDLAFIYNEPDSNLAKKQAELICGNKAYQIGVVTNGYSGKPGSMRIPFACTQKAALERGSAEAKEELRKADVQESTQRLANIPWDGKQANKFFLQETHHIMMLDCGWAGNVGFATGKSPTVLLGGTYYPGDNSSFKDGQYKLAFNSGSMFVMYNPQKVAGYISEANSVTPCSAVRIGNDG